MVRTLRLVGLDVGTAEAQLQAALRGAEGVTGHVVDTGEECWARLRLRADSPATAAAVFDALEPALRGAFGPAWYGVDDETLEGQVGRLLRARGWTVALAESCTGGLVGHRLTQVGGSSAYFERGFVVYSNAAKQTLLGVPEHGAAGARGGVGGLRGGDGARGARAGRHRRRRVRDRHRRARRRHADEAGRDGVRGASPTPAGPSSSATASTATGRATRRSPRSAPWTCSAVDVSRPPEGRGDAPPRPARHRPRRPVSSRSGRWRRHRERPRRCTCGGCAASAHGLSARGIVVAPSCGIGWRPVRRSGRPR